MFMFFYVRLPVDDLKKIETCQSISGLYVKVYNLILVHCLVLSTKCSLIVIHEYY
jgi:hypothetical protein